MILVLGKNGQLARCLRQRLGEYGVAIGSDQMNFLKPDTVIPTLEKFCAGKKIHAIVNAMAYTNVDRAEGQMMPARAMNALSPEKVAIFARELGVPFVHISSDYVYGRDDDQWIKESEECDPKCVYGVTKIDGDTRVSNVGGAFIIVRTSWVWDVNGENFPNKIRRLITERAAAIGRGETPEPIKVVNDQWGRPTPAMDLADACLRLLAERAKHPEIDGQIFHYTSKGPALTWCGWAIGIQKTMGPKGANIPHATEVQIVPVSSTEFPVSARRPKNSRLSLEKISKYGVFKDDPSAAAPGSV